MVDDSAHHERPLDEVLVLQPMVLESFGWRIMTVLRRDWYEDPTLVLGRIERRLTSSVEA